MSIQRYRIISPTMAVFQEGDHRVEVKIPAGSILGVEADLIDADIVIEVTWAEKRVMMFTGDIRIRGEKVGTTDG